MKYAKIVVKNNYEQKGDLVLRSYVRAIKKIRVGNLLDGDNALIYGVVDDNNCFHELFTNETIDYDNYILVSVEELFDAATVPNDKKELLIKIMEKVLFGKNIEFDFEISTNEELAKDRAVEFEAYDNLLSRINPYRRLSEMDNQELYNAYNNFLYKVKEVETIRKFNKEIQNYDDYDINNYRYIPHVESEEQEYLVFEVPKRLIKK